MLFSCLAAGPDAQVHGQWAGIQPLQHCKVNRNPQPARVMPSKHASMYAENLCVHERIEHVVHDGPHIPRYARTAWLLLSCGARGCDKAGYICILVRDSEKRR